ncbi:MAG: ribonuclease PH [Fimbriimonadaceae bacterium]|nr:ribonuclease PH [Fimbriimonadaceae bacterium]
MSRPDHRQPPQMRPVELAVGVSRWAEGSCEITVGDTQVLCLASIEESVPPFRRETGLGWVPAEYDMLPRATSERRQRTGRSGKPDARALEISRLVGRSLRSVVDFAALGSRTITVDCDVLQADGGTRTASITGAYVALVEALKTLQARRLFAKLPVRDSVAAVSVGVLGNDELLDLCYAEDHRAAVDMNVVMTGRLRLVEIQGTAEERPFSREQLNRLLDLAEQGIRELTALQQTALA